MADNDTWFNEFWRCGMRKVNKKAARKAWDKLMKGKSDREQMEFVEMARSDIEWRMRNQFGFPQLHPASYLNGERWEDDKVLDNKVQNNGGRKLSLAERTAAQTQQILSRGAPIQDSNGYVGSDDSTFRPQMAIDRRR